MLDTNFKDRTYRRRSVKAENQKEVKRTSHNENYQKPSLISPFSEVKQRIFRHAFNGENSLKQGRTRTGSSLCAVEKEPQFELDPDKAKEALQKLDKQLQTLSQKQITPPKKRDSSYDLESVSDPNRARNLMREEMPEISGSYLAYSAVILVLFTIFYNILFLTVIKPSVDGPEEAPSAIPAVREAPMASVMRPSSPLLSAPYSSPKL